MRKALCKQENKKKDVFFMGSFFLFITFANIFHLVL